MQTINHRKVVQEIYESGVLHDMLGVPRPHPPPQPKTNDVEKFDISDIYPQEDDPDAELSDHSGPERYRRESDEDDEEDGESRYRMRSSRLPPAKRRKLEVYEEYPTDDDDYD